MCNLATLKCLRLLLRGIIKYTLLTAFEKHFATPWEGLNSS